MKLYYLLGRILSPFAFIGLRAYSLLVKTKRARLIVRNEYGELLLVKSWLSSGRWGMPGGGLHRGEGPEEAAVRELQEETGIAIDVSALQYAATIQIDNHQEVVFRTAARKDALSASVPGGLEIVDAAWFSLEELPPLGSLAKRIIQEVETT